MEEFAFIPVLGRKTDVPANDPSLFQDFGGNVATHDVGGLNFDLSRNKHSCTKSNGSVKWSLSANAQATKCLGLRELLSGSNRDHIMFDNGVIYVYDSNRTPTLTTCAGQTLATDNTDLYSMIQVGAYIVIADRGEHTPYKWKNGDAGFTALINGGTAYKFRYLVNFARRVVGLYCPDDTGAPDLSVRWGSSWPSTAVADMTFGANDQLYIPNDDSIVGGATMGTDKCFIYCQNSIQQLIYSPNYDTPFKCLTAVSKQGGVNHHSIVNLGDRHFFFNKHYGFCEYRGGTQMPYGGRPISEDIETDLQDVNHTYADLIVGTYIPETRCCVWTVPMIASSTPNRLLFYNIDSGQWHWEDKAMRFVDYWQAYDNFTWINLIRALGGMDKASGTATTNTASHLIDTAANFDAAGVIVGDEAFNTTDNTHASVTNVTTTDLTLDSDAFPDGDEEYEVGTGAIWLDAGVKSWGYYASLAKYLVYANTDGNTYSHSSETLGEAGDLDGYRIEPIMDFGDPKRHDLLKEIWMQMVYSGDFDIHVWHRGGNTVGEIESVEWGDPIGTIAADTTKPVLYCAKSYRLHQIKWGTDSNSESFEVNKIILRFEPQSEH